MLNIPQPPTLQDSPDAFGLPPNMDRALQQTLSGAIVQQLRVLTRAGSLTEGFNREAWASALTPTLELWKRLSQVQWNISTSI